MMGVESDHIRNWQMASEYFGRGLALAGGVMLVLLKFSSVTPEGIALLVFLTGIVFFALAKRQSRNGGKSDDSV